LWNQYRYTYNILKWCYDSGYDVKKIIEQIITLIDYTVKTDVYKSIYEDARKYKNKCIIEWNKKKIQLSN
jgi:hypothetical protein